MFNWLSANMGTIIVVAVLIVIIALIIRSMIKDKEKGQNPFCGGRCADCHGVCHMKDKIEKDSEKTI